MAGSYECSVKYKMGSFLTSYVTVSDSASCSYCYFYKNECSIECKVASILTGLRLINFL